MLRQETTFKRYSNIFKADFSYLDNRSHVLISAKQKIFENLPISTREQGRSPIGVKKTREGHQPLLRNLSPEPCLRSGRKVRRSPFRVQWFPSRTSDIDWPVEGHEGSPNHCQTRASVQRSQFHPSSGLTHGQDSWNLKRAMFRSQLVASDAIH